jgi:hypothetical protein
VHVWCLSHTCVILESDLDLHVERFVAHFRVRQLCADSKNLVLLLMWCC